MDKVIYDQDSEHQKGVKDVQEPFMSHEVAIISLRVLNYPED